MRAAKRKRDSGDKRFTWYNDKTHKGKRRTNIGQRFMNHIKMKGVEKKPQKTMVQRLLIDLATTKADVLDEDEEQTRSHEHLTWP
jgi:hypothetical protein